MTPGSLPEGHPLRPLADLLDRASAPDCDPALTCALFLLGPVRGHALGVAALSMLGEPSITDAIERLKLHAARRQEQNTPLLWYVQIDDLEKMRATPRERLRWYGIREAVEREMERTCDADNAALVLEVLECEPSPVRDRIVEVCRTIDAFGAYASIVHDTRGERPAVDDLVRTLLVQVGG